jgi:hypothetical protein
MDDDRRSGQRYEIVVLKINRNNEGSIKELIALKDHFRRKGENYSLLTSSYGSPAKALKKTIGWYLDSLDKDDQPVLKHPRKTLYEINKMFIDRKVVSSGNVADMGVQADVEKLVSGIVKFFGADTKKPEEIE